MEESHYEVKESGKIASLFELILFLDLILILCKTFHKYKANLNKHTRHNCIYLNFQ